MVSGVLKTQHHKRKETKEMANIEVKEPVCLECGVKVNPYLTYAQIQQIVNAVNNFDTWADRQANIDVLVLYHATDLTKEEIEEIGHDAFIQSGVMDEVKDNIQNYYLIGNAIEYTHSTARALNQISKQLPTVFKEAMANAIKK